MKRLMLIPAILMAIVACGEKNVPETPSETTVPTDITLSAASFDVAQAGENLSLTVTAPQRPTVSGLPTWITLTDGTFNNYKITFTLKVAANTDYASREADLTVASGTLSKTVKVTQAAAEALVIDPETLSASASATTLSFSVTASSEPTVTGAPGWMTLKAGTYSDYKVRYTVNLTENTGDADRTATLSVKAGSLTGTVTVTQTAPGVEPDVNVALQMAKKLGLGWDLGNQMDAYDANGVANETAWGGPRCTQQTFDKLKSYGFSSVRVPITWLGHIGAAPNYTLDEAWLARVEEIVGYCEKAGLNCIINTHHDECNNDGHWLDVKGAAASASVKAQITAELKAIWTQIANRFKDKGDFLIFEPFNELQDGGWGWSAAFRANPIAQTDIINEWNQAFVDAVRATGGNNATRWLGIVGYAASSTISIQYLELPEDSADNRLMVGFHSYDPYNYCLGKTYSQWGHTRTSDKGVSELDEQALLDILEPYYTKYVSKGIPVYIGEFGCVNRSNAKEQQFQKYYMEYFCKAAATYGMPAFLWDNGCVNTTGENFGYVHHGTGAYIGQGSSIIPAIVKAMTNDAYTLENVYNNAPK